MEKILTIVIPTYNMQDYLRRCLDSLIVPEEQMKQLEVLVINDGSKDNSSAIAHEYQDKYPDTFRVIDKENGNYGSCVNRGLKEATGKYFRILDADDWFDTVALCKFIGQLQHWDVDVIYTAFNTVELKGKSYRKSKITKQSQFKTNVCIDLTINALDDKFFAMHSLTYKLELLNKIKFKQEEKICYTDTEYVFYPLGHAKNLVCLDDVLYQYFVGREGQSMSLKRMSKNFSHFYKVLTNLLSYKFCISLPTQAKLCSYYFVVLLRYMLDIHLFMCIDNKKQDVVLHEVIDTIIKRDVCFKDKINAINLKGCCYVTWWLSNSAINKVKLWLFIKLKRVTLKI